MRPLQAVAGDLEAVLVAAACVLLEIVGGGERRVRAGVGRREFQDAGVMDEVRAVVLFRVRE